MSIEPKDEFIQFNTMNVIETTHGSLNLHIPSKVVKKLKLKKGQRMECFANPKTKIIEYRLVKKKP